MQQLLQLSETLELPQAVAVIPTKTRNRPTSIPVSMVNKRIVYYLENKPFDTRLVVTNRGLYIGLLHNLFADKHKVLELDVDTGNMYDRFPEKLPLFVSANYHITERSIIRFNRLIWDGFIEHIVRLAIVLHKYGVSRSEVISTEIDRAELFDLITKSMVEKACYKRMDDLQIASYRMKALK